MERNIRMREKLTINNLKAILSGEMKNGKESMKITLDGRELMGH